MRNKTRVRGREIQREKEREGLRGQLYAWHAGSKWFYLDDFLLLHPPLEICLYGVYWQVMTNTPDFINAYCYVKAIIV